MGSDTQEQRPRLGDRIVASGLAKREDVERAAEWAEAHGHRIGDALVMLGYVDDTELHRELAEQHGQRFVTADALFARLDPELVAQVPHSFQDRKRVLPVERDGDVLVVASCEPEVRILDLLGAFGCDEAERLLLTPTDFRRLQWAVDLGRVASPDAGEAHGDGRADLLARDLRLEPSQVSLSDALLADAAGERASDLHLEQYGERVRVRLRIDGDLQDVDRFAMGTDELRGVVNVFKVRARLDIAERRRPQGGRFSMRVGNTDFDLRVQTQPALHGEHLIVRLLPQEHAILAVDRLGFPEPVRTAFDAAIAAPSGLVLVVGPTGSGKSTTLYAGLQALAADTARKVVTVEDPIEVAIPGIQQCAARPDLGFGFASAMRAFVREDPDVIFVGEIRDGETALEALRAAQTGHLVLSTLHANDSVDAVQRLFDLGMHPNTIAAELRAVFAQRLAKRTCPRCREPADPSLLRELGLPSDPPLSIGIGCARCGGRGTRGRQAVAEYLPTGPALRRAIAHQTPLDELRDVARDGGWIPLHQHARALAEQGELDPRGLRAILAWEAD